MATGNPTPREFPLDPDVSALLSIAVQNFSVRRDSAEFKSVPDSEIETRCADCFDRQDRRVIPNPQRPQISLRAIKDYCLQVKTDALDRREIEARLLN